MLDQAPPQLEVPHQDLGQEPGHEAPALQQQRDAGKVVQPDGTPQGPSLALEVEGLRQADPTLDATRAQRRALNIELCDLEQALLRAWRLPELLVRITDDRLSDDPQARTVVLALRIARHSAAGWDRPALSQDLRAAGELLGLSSEAVRDKVMRLEAPSADDEPTAPSTTKSTATAAG